MKERNTGCLKKTRELLRFWMKQNFSWWINKLGGVPDFYFILYFCFLFYFYSLANQLCSFVLFCGFHLEVGVGRPLRIFWRDVKRTCKNVFGHIEASLI